MVIEGGEQWVNTDWRIRAVVLGGVSRERSDTGSPNNTYNALSTLAEAGLAAPHPAGEWRVGWLLGWPGGGGHE